MTESPIPQRAWRSALARNKYFLYLTAFFSGMSVMAVELGASRLLAPYFSSSQIVWTVIIGTIMIALALGHVIGGRLVDKRPDPDHLYFRLLIAALWIAAIPFVGKYGIAACSLALALVVKNNFLVWASLASCFLLFVFPLLMLGTVSPALIKFSVDNLEDNGKIVGELEAISTIGSIIGTFLPTFVTIPTVGTAATFLLFAGILACISAIYFLSRRKHRVRSVVAILVIFALFFVPGKNTFAFWETDLLYEGESIYNYLQVKETPRSIIFSTNVLEGVQSILMKDESQMTGLYYEYALAGPLMAGVPAKPGGNSGNVGSAAAAAADHDLLILGLGTGTYATQCLNYFPGMRIEGVELDEKIVSLAHSFFRLPQAVNVAVADGRIHLQNSGQFDVILVDAYQDITIPFQLSSLEFFSMVNDHLRREGVMVVNLNMHSGKEGAINDYLCDTISAVFPYVYTMPLPNVTNTVLFAFQDLQAMDRFAQGILTLPDNDPLTPLLSQLQAGLIRYMPGNLLLTDDKAPVELLGIQVIDEIIGGYLQDMQQQFRKEGILGLMRSVGF